MTLFNSYESAAYTYKIVIFIITSVIGVFFAVVCIYASLRLDFS